MLFVVCNNSLYLWDVRSSPWSLFTDQHQCRGLLSSCLCAQIYHAYYTFFVQSGVWYSCLWLLCRFYVISSASSSSMCQCQISGHVISLSWQSHQSNTRTCYDNHTEQPYILPWTCQQLLHSYASTSRVSDTGCLREVQVSHSWQASGI